MGEFITTESGDFIKELNDQLQQSNQVDINVGYATTHGFNLIMSSLEKIPKTRILIGMEDNVTFKSALKQLRLDVMKYNSKPSRLIQLLDEGKLEIRFDITGHNHSKFYLFHHHDGDNHVMVGSQNLSYSAFKTNREGAIIDKEAYTKAQENFEYYWSDAKQLENPQEDLTPTPEEIQQSEVTEPSRNVLTQQEAYIRILEDIYGGDLSFSYHSQFPEYFQLLKYQEDAVIQMENILKRYNGVFLADVVGLGKTYTTILFLLRLPDKAKPVIIVPASTVDAWKETLKDFHITNVPVFSHQSLHQIVEEKEDGTFEVSQTYSHVIIDEAHRMRNNRGITYKRLHALCSHNGVNKKVVLITATPLNNTPKELKNLLALFQDIDGTNALFEDQSIKKFFAPLLRNLHKAKMLGDKVLLDKVVQENAKCIRDNIVSKLTVRRTRKDITKFYQSDMNQNGWVFPKVNTPHKVTYELSSLQNRLLEITSDEFDKLTFARYKLQNYLYEGLFENAHRSLTSIIKTNLMKRLDSSFDAFRETLGKMIELYEATLTDMTENNYVKTTYRIDEVKLESPESLLLDYPKDFKEPDKFRQDVEQDLEALKQLQSIWGSYRDNKFDELLSILKSIQPNKENGKLVIFSQYATTVYSISERLKAEGLRVLAYSSSDAKTLREEVELNFNANVPKDKQVDDYDILFTTDTLSEGVNLHRANKIMNYDIPWNPSLVIQRVGRANRIGTTFPTIDIYNFFPIETIDGTIKSERNIISKLKSAFHIYGDDENVLTDDDSLNDIETIESQIHDDIIAANEIEAEDTNLDAYFQKQLRDYAIQNRSNYEYLKKLPIELIALKNQDLDNFEAVLYVPNESNQEFYGIKEGKPVKLDTHETLQLLERTSTSEMLTRDLPDDYTTIAEDLCKLIKRDKKVNQKKFIGGVKDKGKDLNSSETLNQFKKVRAKAPKEYAEPIKGVFNQLKKGTLTADVETINDFLKEIYKPIETIDYEYLVQIIDCIDLPTNNKSTKSRTPKNIQSNKGANIQIQEVTQLTALVLI